MVACGSIVFSMVLWEQHVQVFIVLASLDMIYSFIQINANVKKKRQETGRVPYFRNRSFVQFIT